MAETVTDLTLASPDDREQLYRLRHQVYATELGQHVENAGGRLTDALDAVNTYVIAKRQGRAVGFVAITPPSAVGYSIDKYFDRRDVPVTFDAGLYEVRLLTVVPEQRRSQLAGLLMYAALRYCESRGAQSVVAIGRLELLDLYERVGLRRLGRRVTAGAVTYELLAARVSDLRDVIERCGSVVRRVGRRVRWNIPGVGGPAPAACYHGGAFFEAIGDEFDDLTRADAIISADVLDAWFPPAPVVLDAIQANLAFALRTSPPTYSDGLRRVIARVRHVGTANVLPGSGSSDLIFGAFRTWMTRDSRVLILDPTYGEYAHVLEHVIGARVDRLVLRRDEDYDLDPIRLAEALVRGYDWLVLVNPNSPTGRYLDGGSLTAVLRTAPPSTRVWVDETYVDFTGGESLERFAAASNNVIVSKSMSKAYALSGVRVGYLCGPETMIAELRAVTPPWAVGLPGQIAACEALRATDYYEARWRETAALRTRLSDALVQLGWQVAPGAANFVLCHLPDDGPDAGFVARASRARGLYLREFGGAPGSFGHRTLRIAVKDEDTTRRMIRILRDVLTAPAEVLRHKDFAENSSLLICRSSSRSV